MYFLCRHFLSFLPFVRFFSLLIIQFVPFKKITNSMKVYIKHSNTVRLNIEIKCILICKICCHSKYIAVWKWGFTSNLSADTLVSNALKLFIYYLFDQQIRFCMFCNCGHWIRLLPVVKFVKHPFLHSQLFRCN